MYKNNVSLTNSKIQPTQALPSFLLSLLSRKVWLSAFWCKVTTNYKNAPPNRTRQWTLTLPPDALAARCSERIIFRARGVLVRGDETVVHRVQGRNGRRRPYLHLAGEDVGVVRRETVGRLRREAVVDAIKPFFRCHWHFCSKKLVCLSVASFLGWSNLYSLRVRQ